MTANALLFARALVAKSTILKRYIRQINGELSTRVGNAHDARTART